MTTFAPPRLSLPGAEPKPERRIFHGEELARELFRASRSFGYFLRNHVWIADRTPDGALTGIIKWEWWDLHDSLVADFEQESRLIELKARQLGLSWILAALHVHGALFTPNYLGGVTSMGQDESDEFIDKCRFIVYNLPYAPLPTLTTDNTEELEFTASGGRVLGFPSTPKAGRGYTFTRFVADEAAFHAHAESNYAAYSAATDYGQIIIVSSAGDEEKQVLTDWFQRMWLAAAAGENGFKARFDGYDARPGRDAEWVAKTKQRFASNPGQYDREYPSTPEQAFASMLNLRFDADAIAYGRANTKHHMTVVSGAPEGLGPLMERGILRLWSKPRPTEPYTAYTDGASGRAGDYSCTPFIETKTLRHVLTLRENMLEPREHARIVLLLLKWFNNAYYGFERAEGGTDIVQVMERSRYPRMYWHQERPATLEQRRVGVTPGHRLGYPMTEQTRVVLINGLAQVLVDGSFSSPDPVLWDELGTFIRNEKKHNRPEAAPGRHDDLVLSISGCVYLATTQASAQYVGSTASTEPRRLNARGGNDWNW